MSKIKLVMLDFDGTIADSFASVICCAEKMCLNAGYSFDKSIIERSMGCTTEECIARLIGNRDPEVIEQLTAAYNVIYNREGLDMINLFDVTRLGLMPYLDCIIGVECVEHGKPAPDIAIEALRRTGVAADEAIAVGDSFFDICMGRDAGCHTCGVTYGADTAETLTKYGAEWIINSFAELEKIVLG